MADILKVANEYKKKLMDVESQAGAPLVKYYQQSYNHLKGELDKLHQKIDERKKSGEPVSLAWLKREERYKDLMSQIDDQMKRFSPLATKQVTQGQSDAVKLATRGAKEMASAEAKVAGSWNQVPTRALESFVGTLQDGSPLKDLFDKLGSQASEKVKETLTKALITGMNPRQTAKKMQEAFGGNLSRALTVARTEQLRSYRQATVETYRENEDVVEGWIRIESLDDITCVICIEEHGKEYDTKDDFESHPNCRGTMIPKVKGTNREIEKGTDWFAKQSDDKQREVLGKDKYESYKSGEIDLHSLVQKTYHDDWGGGRRERTLEEAKAAFTENAPTSSVEFGKSFTELYDLERELRNESNEHAAVFDLDGTLLFKTTSNSGHTVAFTDQQLEGMKGKILTHNHPEEIQSLSYGDFGAFVLNGLYEMRAVDPKYSYSLSGQYKGGMAPREIQRRHKEIKSQVADYGDSSNKYLKMLDSGVDPLFVKGEVSHEVSEKLAKEMGLTYSRTITDSLPSQAQTPAEKVEPTKPKFEDHPTYKRLFEGERTGETDYRSGEKHLIEDVTQTIFGQSVELQDVVKMAGIPNDANVQVFGYHTKDKTNGTISIRADGPDYSIQRQFFTQDGKTIVDHEFFRVTGRQTIKEGDGAFIFAKAVEDYQKYGVSKILTHAAGDAQSAYYNGYYTWARLGYDGPVPRKVKEKFANRFPTAASPKKISDILANPEAGPSWWKEHGKDFKGTFDLTEGSKSMKILDAYREAKGYGRNRTDK